MAELGKLLSFMSSWDRQAVLEEYSARFAAAEDPEALIEELGTPTRVAYVLAQSYVPTPAPVPASETVPEAPAAASAPENAPDQAEEQSAPADLDRLLEEVSSEEFWTGPTAEEQPSEAPERAETPVPETPAEIPAPEPAPVPAPAQPKRPRRRVRVGGLFGFLALCIVPGIPVALLLIAVGLPFMALGAFGALLLVRTALAAFPNYKLWSDSLLLAGAGLVGLAVCLLVFWLGLWISISLCRLWIREALVPWGRRLIFAREED